MHISNLLLLIFGAQPKIKTQYADFTDNTIKLKISGGKNQIEGKISNLYVNT